MVCTHLDNGIQLRHHIPTALGSSYIVPGGIPDLLRIPIVLALMLLTVPLLLLLVPLRLGNIPVALHNLPPLMVPLHGPLLGPPWEVSLPKLGGLVFA